MAADQGIQTADDGVAEVSMTSARANLTQLLRDVRYGGRPGAFTERGERSAYVVPPDFYEQALRDRALVELLERRAQRVMDPDAPVKNHAQALRVELDLARQDVDARLNIAES
ncbi:type II toxin-antitoxin system Phd/YefM family antitoxin [Streptomyces cupreus]|uniref:Antitoxin n=1 Tax=Streptomyces cupreus TaxID=2759956 RepID=A0A7X1M9Z3_9ACTN|nr:type II toxin-antitoxin system Phd/YefM family antitoxin [Streptomyces cupreus]MBC2903188.1 type II toxin-antitoxin system Phd/YefM family antitoxin [Streptomyces cupreus]